MDAQLSSVAHNSVKAFSRLRNPNTCLHAVASASSILLLCCPHNDTTTEQLLGALSVNDSSSTFPLSEVCPTCLILGQISSTAS